MGRKTLASQAAALGHTAYPARGPSNTSLGVFFYQCSCGHDATSWSMVWDQRAWRRVRATDRGFTLPGTSTAGRPGSAAKARKNMNDHFREVIAAAAASAAGGGQ